MKKKEFSREELLKIGGRIGELMNRSPHKTPTALARATGLSQPSVRDIVNGDTKEIKAITVMAIANALNCSVGYLLLMTDQIRPRGELSGDEATLLEGFALLDEATKQDWIDAAKRRVNARRETCQSKRAA